METLSADAVEIPATARTARKYAEVYTRVAALDVGQALRLTFDTEKEMLSAYSSLRAALMSRTARKKNSVASRRGLTTKRWDIFKQTAALSVAVIRLPDAEGDDA